MDERKEISTDKALQRMRPINLEEVERLFLYDKDTGLITRKIQASQMHAGSIAGTTSPDGYVKVAVNKRLVLAHRLAWALHHKESPAGFIDHINHDRSDNRIENLRLVSRRQNNHHASVRKDNKLGIKGVRYNKRDKRFIAEIRVDKKRTSLGSFMTARQAAIAYNEAARVAHGKFAVLNNIEAIDEQ